jgi:hypothetical protein
MYLPTPGENDCLVKRSIIQYSGARSSIPRPPSGTAARADRLSFSHRLLRKRRQPGITAAVFLISFV